MPPSWIRALIGCRVMETSTPRRQSGCDDLPKSYDIMRHNLLRQGLYDRRYLDVTPNGLVRQQDTFGHKVRSEEHTSELQSPDHLVCRLLLEKKKKQYKTNKIITDNLL